MAGFLEGRNRSPIDYGNVLILGLGKSGNAAFEYVNSQLDIRSSDRVTVAAPQIPAEVRERYAVAERRGFVTFLEGVETFDEHYDLCIVSPGISEFSDFYLAAKAASTEIISEVEFAWRECRSDKKWIAITGTNGKTTTTALTAHLLNTAGVSAVACGNIGDPCIDCIGGADVLVAEVSSYQLASTRHFSPDVAVILNITPDHVKWHHGLENYIDAKYRVLANMPGRPGAVAVLGAVDEMVRGKVRELRAIPEDERGFAYVPVGTAAGVGGDMRVACGSDNAAYVREDGMMVVAFGSVEHELVRADELLIPGAHNVANALSAAAAALAIGASVEGVREGLRTFRSLEHRIEECGSVGDVSCYNDSKSTNVDSTLAALSAFDPKRPIVMLGGDDKFTDLAPLVAAAEAHCKAAVLYGASHDRFAEVFAGASLPVSHAGGMEEALDVALSLSEPGDVVLLSPACASFDEFDNYEQRGHVFKELVAARAAG